MWNLSRPLGEFMLVAIYHYFRSGTRTASSGVRGLREAVGEGIATDGIPFPRPSVTHQLTKLLR